MSSRGGPPRLSAGRAGDLVAMGKGGWWARGEVLVIALAVYAAASYYINPWVSDLILPYLDFEIGPKVFLLHALAYTLTTAVLCFACHLFYVKRGYLQPMSLTRNVGDAVAWGVLFALILSAITAGFFLAKGKDVNVVFNWWDIGGNLLANLYEEVIYRGLLFSALLFSVRKPWFAILASGFIFMYSHTDQPALLAFGTVLTGVCFGYPYFRTGSLLAPFIVHQMSDIIVDSMFAHPSF